MKIILTKKEKIIFIAILGIVILLAIKGFINDYKMVAHNKKVFKSFSEDFKKQFPYKFDERLSVFKLDQWVFLFTGIGNKRNDRFNWKPIASYSPLYLNDSRVLAINTRGIGIEDSGIITKISFAGARDILYASNMEEDKNSEGTYYFYIVRVSSKYTKGHGYMSDIDSAVLYKYKIDHASTILCEGEYHITLPKEAWFDRYDETQPFLFKEYNEKTIFYLPVRTSRAASYDVSQFDLEGNMRALDITGIDCLVLNAAEDSDIYYVKKGDDKYNVIKNDRVLTAFEDKIIYGCVLSTGELYILKGYKDENTEYAFNFIQGGSFIRPRGYIYSPSSDNIRPLYFFLYFYTSSFLELPSIFLRGFCYFDVINIIPYR